MTTLPQAFDIDIVAGCNLRCPSCPQGNSRSAERPRGIMALSMFRSILAKIARENPIVSYVGLYSWTEPLLHPELPLFVEAVKSYGYRCMLSSNLNRARNLDALIQAGPDVLHVSLSGYYQDTYGRTHKSGDIENVKRNMRELRRVMNIHGSGCQVVVVYHMYRDNMGDDKAHMEALCAELGFTFNPVWAYLMPVDKVIDYHEGRVAEEDRNVIELFAVTPDEVKAIALRNNKPDCDLRTSRTAINADGSVALCCGTFDRKHDIAPSFLEISQKALMRLKYQNPLCGPCMEHGIHVSGGHGGIHEWNAIGMERVRNTVQRSAPIPQAIEPPANPTSNQPKTRTEDKRAPVTLYLPTPKNGAGAQPRRPKLTAIIPTFNRAKYLDECLASVCATTVDCEILVSDNGSSDETGNVIEQWMARDARIRAIRHERNRGSWFNVTNAMKEARGEFLCLLGDDDLIVRGNFESKLGLLEQNPAIGLVYSRWFRIDSEGASLGVCNWPGLLNHSYAGGRDDFKDQIPAGYIMHQSVVFRRELYDERGGLEGWVRENGSLRYIRVWERPEIGEEIEPQGAHSDWDMLLRYCRNTQTAFINEPLVKIRIHSNSNSEVLGRANAMFSEGRLAVWRKWLVDNENPPVIDDSMWQRMREAFAPDLQWELGGDTVRIRGYLDGLEQIRRDHIARVEQTFSRSSYGTKPSTIALPVEIGAAQQAPELPSTAAIRSTVTSSGTAVYKALHWCGPLTDASGYAEEGRSFVLALESNGWSVSAQSVNWSDRIALLPAKLESRLLGILGRAPARGTVNVSHIFPPHFTRRAEAALNVGRTMFETDRLPAGWADACNQMDQVWVPSEFNRESFLRAGVREEKLVVIPGALSSESYGPHVLPLKIEGARGFNFLSVFDWSLRKGWDVLLRAYVGEFHADEDVALILKTHSSLGLTTDQIGAAILDYIENTLGRNPDRIPEIILQSADLPAAHMPNLYRAADCFVLPTRGEGWGRPFMEAMATGLPVIGTNWSGQRAFMTPENSCLIDCEIVEVPEPAWREAAVFQGHCWAEPSVAHLRSLMRECQSDRARAESIGATARADISSLYSYERVAGTIQRAIEDVPMLARAAA